MRESRGCYNYDQGSQDGQMVRRNLSILAGNDMAMHVGKDKLLEVDNEMVGSRVLQGKVEGMRYKQGKSACVGKVADEGMHADDVDTGGVIQGQDSHFVLK